MSDGFHPPLEEYLEAVWELEDEGVRVIQARLAEHLGHSPPAVSEMIQRLRAEGYVKGSGRVVALTAKGRRRAESVVRKHRIAERFLTDILGLAWHKTHIEACRWEHVMSDEVEERLVAMLGNPSTCPHGNPIPGAPGPERKLQALADSEVGQRVRLERVTEQVEVDFDTLVYLDDHGFIPGADADVAAKAPDGTLTLGIDGKTLALGPELARRLYVLAL